MIRLIAALVEGHHQGIADDAVGVATVATTAGTATAK
jgi:hypothetical protein